ncbi:hypothetical protein Tco_1379583 [Tanacetum coccineum]
MDVRSDVYVLSNGCRKSRTTAMTITGSMHQAEIWATKGLLNKAKGNVLGMKIFRDQSDYCSEDQYAVSIKEDTAYPCLHSPKTTKGMKINTPYPEDSIRRIQDMESI